MFPDVPSTEAIKEGIKLFENGKSLRKAAKLAHIPHSTLHRKIKENCVEIKKRGPATVLTDEEEKELVSWLLSCSAVALPRTGRDVREAAASILLWKQRPNPFTDGIPSRK